MAARVVDLEVVDIEGLAWYRFRWEGPEWHEALKAAVPPEWRSYDTETRLWMVEAAFHDELAGIFPNLQATVDAIRSQLSLFGADA